MPSDILSPHEMVTLRVKVAHRIYFIRNGNLRRMEGRDSNSAYHDSGKLLQEPVYDVSLHLHGIQLILLEWRIGGCHERRTT